MKLLFTLTFICLSFIASYTQSIDCSNQIFLSKKEVEDKVKVILENTDSNEEMRLELSIELYCHSKNVKDDLLTALACNHLGLYYYQKRIKTKAFEFLSKAEKILIANPGSPHYRDNLNYFGLLYHFSGDHALAVNYLEKFHAACIAQKSDSKKLADSKNDLGLIYIDIGEYELAKNYLESAYETLITADDKYGAGYSLLNLGRNEFLNNPNHTANSYEYANKAISLWEPIEFKRGLFYAKNALSEFYLENDDKKALAFAKQTLALAVENDFGSLGNVYRNLGSAQLNLGELGEAKKSFQFCLSYAKEHYIRDLFEVSYNNLLNLYENEGNAANYKELAMVANEYFTTKTQQDQNAEKEWIEATQQSSMLSEQVKIQNEVIDKKNLVNKLLFLLSVLIAFTAGLIYYLWIKGKRVNTALANANDEIKQINDNLEKANFNLSASSEILKENKTKIEEQNKALSALADQKILLFNDRKKFINKIEQFLFKLDQHDHSVIALQKFVKENSADNVWRDLDKLTDLRNKNFNESILKKHPNLTQKDLSLCHYLLLDLNTKEIANLSYQNPDTVKVARSRLRKKMGLKDPKINLTNYLKSI